MKEKSEIEIKDSKVNILQSEINILKTKLYKGIIVDTKINQMKNLNQTQSDLLKSQCKIPIVLNLKMKAVPKP